MSNLVVLDDKNWTGILRASQEGDVAEITRLLKDGASVETVDSNGWTPLMIASRHGQIGAIECLLAAGANVEASCGPVRTALVFACESNQDGAVERLLAAGADANAKGGLVRACAHGSLNIVKRLFAAGAVVTGQSGNSAIAFAIWGGSVDTLKCLVRAGADVNSVVNNGLTALMLSIKCNNVEAVKYLLHAGADSNATTEGGKTALMYACSHGNNIKAVRYLLHAGADINAATEGGMTALMYACSCGGSDFAMLLISAGANIMAVNNVGRAAHEFVDSYCGREVVQFMLRGLRKPIVMTANERKLMEACENDDSTVVAELLARNVDANVPSYLGGFTAFEISCTTPKADCVRAILAAGAVDLKTAKALRSQGMQIKLRDHGIWQNTFPLEAVEAWTHGKHTSAGKVMTKSAAKK
jgi:ankyrin repeat protein